MPDIPRYHILPNGDVGEVLSVLQSMRERGLIQLSTKIRTYDAESGIEETITGMLVATDGTIKLTTDEP